MDRNMTGLECSQKVSDYWQGICPDTFEKLKELLEQEQFELLPGYRVVYLMNDAVESFLVFENARMTGTYLKEFDGEVFAFLDRKEPGYVLAVHQGKNVCTVFFDDLKLEVQLYEYGTVGHFWVDGYEYLRVLEYQLAIMRDKLDYLGADYCTETEQELAALVDFPPLNYSCYPAVPEKYIVPREDPWRPSKEAVAVMLRLAEESGDQKLYRCLEQYRSICPQEFETGWTEPKKVHRMTKKLAGMMCRTCHSKTVDLLAQEIREATEIYPKRVFSGIEGDYYRKVMQAVRQRKEELAAQQMDVVVFRQEPFVTAQDSIEFKGYLMIWKPGRRNRKVRIEEFG